MMVSFGVHNAKTAEKMVRNKCMLQQSNPKLIDGLITMHVNKFNLHTEKLALACVVQSQQT